MKKELLGLSRVLSVILLAASCTSQNQVSDTVASSETPLLATTHTSSTIPVKDQLLVDTTKKVVLTTVPDTTKDSLKIPETTPITEKSNESKIIIKASDDSQKKVAKSDPNTASPTSTNGGSTGNASVEKTNVVNKMHKDVQYKVIDKQITESYKSVTISKKTELVNLSNQVANHESNNSNKNNRSGAVSEAVAGLLTGGETNDLGKWKLWHDLVKPMLESHIQTWKIHPNNRYTVLLQNQQDMPVQGAKVALVTESGSVLWEAITDNTGTAQLWKNIYTEITDSAGIEIRIDYKGQTETIKKPVDYFHGINTKTLKATYVKPEIVDIAFVVDATGSMQDEINFLKEEMNDIIQKTKGKYKNIDLHMGSLFYRCQGNSYVTKHHALTKDYDPLIQFISEQNAGEGGTESVEIALQVGIDKLNWHDEARTRLLFLVLDEPPGYQDSVIQKLHTQIQLAAKKGIKIIPVVASGKVGSEDQNRKMEYLMRSAALATNGNYIFITDHSGIGDSHTEPIIDNYEVELINDIIVRTIENNIYMPDPKKPEDDEIVKDTLAVNNQEDLVSNYIDSLSELMSDDSLLGLLLPYTEYQTKEELKKHLPISKLDTAKFLASQKKVVHTLKIYPNPSNGELKAEINTETDWLYIADLSGKIIQRLATHGKMLIQVNLNDYPNGLYIIQYPDKEKWISAKIVLQK